MTNGENGPEGATLIWGSAGIRGVKLSPEELGAERSGKRGPAQRQA